MSRSQKLIRRAVCPPITPGEQNTVLQLERARPGSPGLVLPVAGTGSGNENRRSIKRFSGHI